MAKQMQNKVCAITGGAGSIGMAAARLLLAEGAKVMLVDLSDAALQRAAAELGRIPARIIWPGARPTSPSLSKSRTALR